MNGNKFTAPDSNHDQWSDIRMADPDGGEWDVDIVVSEGSIEYVNLRIKPDSLTDFIDCLIADVGTARAGRILSAVAERHSLDVSTD